MNLSTTEVRAGRLWQFLAVVRVELRKTLLGRRSIPVYLLALAPVPLFAVVAVLPIDSWVEDGLAIASRGYGFVFQTFMLRAVVFLGCVAVFTNLFRGDVLDRSLHYYFLSPVRRELLVVGKFVAGLLTTLTLFCAMVVITYALLYLPFGVAEGMRFFFQGPGLGHLVAYLGVTSLACLGYGAVFLALGLLFRNPVLPAFAVMGWEFIHFLLPPLLKRLSVIHYLKGLLPFPLGEGPFAVLVELPGAWTSLFGLLLLSAAVLVFAGWRVRRMELHYGDA